jgi:hypothetical protein
MSPDNAGSGTSEISAAVCNAHSLSRKTNRCLVTESEQTNRGERRDALAFSYGYRVIINAEFQSCWEAVNSLACSESRNSEVHSSSTGFTANPPTSAGSRQDLASSRLSEELAG